MGSSWFIADVGHSRIDDEQEQLNQKTDEEDYPRQYWKPEHQLSG